MSYRIDIRRDGDLIESFDVDAEQVLDLILQRRGMGPGAEEKVKEEVTAPRAVNKGGAPAGRIRYCSKCLKPGHRSDTCRDEEGLPPTSPKFEEGKHKSIGNVNASAFIRIRAKHKQGLSKSDICDDEEVTLAQLNAVLESSSWENYQARFPH